MGQRLLESERDTVKEMLAATERRDRLREENKERGRDRATRAYSESEPHKDTPSAGRLGVGGSGGAPSASEAESMPMDAARRADLSELACLQLALHGVLDAISTLLRRICASSDGQLQLQRVGHPLVHALLPLSSESWFGFCRAAASESLSLLLPPASVQAWAEVLQLSALEAILESVPRRLQSVFRLKQETLLELVQETVTQLDKCVRDEARCDAALAYFQGLQPEGADAHGGSGAHTTASAAANAADCAASMDVDTVDGSSG
eukprot:4930936-Pleurochrysis_carterae.AAC.1